MNFNLKQLDKELENILDFWLWKIRKGDSIIGEIAINGTINPSADLGSMYLGRIMYGASAACKSLKTDKYKILADTAYQILINQFKNPKGGFYWALDSNKNSIHDIENNNLAQAFILYGMAEYASFTSSTIAITELEAQTNFLLETLKDQENGGYLDIYDENWEPLENQNKALGTHIHLLEALVKVYNLNKGSEVAKVIHDLIRIIIDKFIEKDTLDCLHRLKPDWTPLPNDIWAGHNAEISWILCKSAKAIGNLDLIEECNKLAINIMTKVIDLAYDKKNGGLFNVIEKGMPKESVKIWWPQAETVIALLNCFEVTGEPHYKELAQEFSKYISTNLITENGEWYTEISADGKPIVNTPLVFFWKSLYHNVRYYIEVKERLS
jgi:mannobiose 2-epimerase